VGLSNQAVIFPIDGVDPILLSEWRYDGYKIAFTNGVFDMLHIGHDHLFREIHHWLRNHKLKLVVAVNDDNSVRRQKPGRPIFPLIHRMRMLASHRLVDAVMPFSDDTPLHAVKEVRPNFLIKGGDYEGKRIVGDEFVKSLGGEVMFIDNMDEPLARTTALIERLKKL
jgi:D-beta-D-heptose 7-phosphate kinase/D-beta-D-heptose 1-phosphate adenosyltransferase